MVVFGLGKNLLFKYVLGHCVHSCCHLNLDETAYIILGSSTTRKILADLAKFLKNTIIARKLYMLFIAFYFFEDYQLEIVGIFIFCAEKISELM